MCAVAAVSLQASYDYWQKKIYDDKKNPIRHYKELKEFEDDLKKTPFVSQKFNPVYDIVIRDFDFKMNFTLDENSGIGYMANTISGYNPGQFCLSSNPDGKAILKLIEFKLNELINKDFDENVIIEIEAIGMADGISVKNNLKYDGSLGEKLQVRYFRVRDPKNPIYANFLEGNTIMKNEYFALLRAYDVVLELTRKYKVDENNIKIFVKEYSEIGDKYRSCNLSITLKNAFLKDYNKLNDITKLFVKHN